MADGIAITAGSGTTVLTDDTGAGGHAQVVKLAIATDGSATLIPADGTDGLLVNLGTNNDVTVTAVTPGTGATSLGKAIDTAAGATDTGVAMLAVRDDALSALTPIETDYVPLRTDANGALWVIPSGTTAVSGTVTANLSATDNAVLDAIEADTTTIAGAVSGTEMQCDVLTVPAPLSTTGNGTAATALRVSIANDSTGIVALTTSSAAIGKLAANTGVDIGDVDVTSIVPGTGATSLGKAIDSIAGATDTGVAMLAIRDDALATLTPADGDYAPLRVDSQGGLVLGGDVHDATDTGNPIKLGAKAETSPAGSTLVADGDRTNLYADVDGLLMTKPFTAYGDILVERLTDTGGTSTASTVFGATANARNFITTIAVYNSSASAGYVDFRDGTAGTVLFTMPLPAGGGSICNFPLPLRQTTTNTALAYDVSGALTTVYISLVGFKSKA